MERAATKTISRTAASGHGGSARSEREPQLFGERLCGINVMLDPPETRGDKQLRRRWRECEDHYTYRNARLMLQGLIDAASTVTTSRSTRCRSW